MGGSEGSGRPCCRTTSAPRRSPPQARPREGRRSAEGTEESYTAGIWGQVHVFLVGLDQAMLEVEDASGYSISGYFLLHEMLAGQVGSDIVFDSRQLHADADDEFKVRVRGVGCAVIVVVDQQE
ncbi:MAG: hypothetical protein GYA57_15205 [Myxococcales bacterium]|nr:hypothetical protein [Myxococcales bacterium]